MADIIGTIDNPLAGAAGYGDINLGLIKFLNNLVALVITLAGLFTLVNLIAAGYQYLSSNNEPQKIAAAANKILQSLIGLAIVAMAFILAGIIGYIFFHDSTILLSPKLFSL
ncbi:MAG: hypothetical protein NTZ93_04295 [Candidatus Beckwithbacteria bacterium]|nr:hypothetical protein [Candidatus Beckwithbacteria bacterium]